MAFSLSPIGNEQQVSSNGAPLSGGLLYTYVAGSTTPAPTYTDSTGSTPQANPIVLNTLGRPTSPIWLADGSAYKFVLTSSTGVAQWTIDEVTGVSSSTPVQDEWVLQSSTPTYVSGTQFTVAGDQTSTYTVNRRVRTVNTGGVYYGYISASAFTSLTTVTVVLDSGSLDSGLSAVSVGILNSENVSIPNVVVRTTGAQSIAGVKTFSDPPVFPDSMFGSSLGASGYQKLPSGLIIQWGVVTSSGTSSPNLTGTFPIAFPTGPYVTVFTVSNGTAYVATIISSSASGFTGVVRNLSAAITTSVSVQYISIGV